MSSMVFATSSLLAASGIAHSGTGDELEDGRHVMAHVSASPARKKMRLSSPTYDDQVEDLDAAAFEALDRIELSLSQQEKAPSSSNPSRRGKLSRTLSQEDKQRRMQSIKAGLVGKHGTESSLPKPRSSTSGKSSQPSSSKKSSPSNQVQESSSIPSDEVPNTDQSDWFKPAFVDASLLPGFQIGSATLRSAPSGEDFSSSNFAAPMVLGFSKVSKTGTTILATPSKSALEEAQKRLKVWEEDDSVVLQDAQILNVLSDISLSRPVLASLSNSPGATKPSGVQAAVTKSFNTPLRSTTPVLNRGRTKAFKSPLLSNSATRNVVYPKAALTPDAHSPMNALRFTTPATKSTRPHPLSSTPLVPQDQASSQIRPIIGTAAQIRTPERTSKTAQISESPGRPTSKPGFVTPFKTGMKPGEPGRFDLERTQGAQRAAEKLASLSGTRIGAPSSTAPPIPPGPSKTTLEMSGLIPQTHTYDDLEDMGINISELSQITPTTAPFYAFHEDERIIGTDAALASLLQSRRSLATKEWVDNHWSLILWKLAGMACLDPVSERSPSKQRWKWETVMRQLEHRYDREIAGGSRPPLRLIAAQDAPASAPMVFCISAIIWPSHVSTDTHASMQSARGPSFGKAGKAKEIGEPLPELEITDGWYRLRARVDKVLARACSKGTIRVGKKIGVVGAKLDSQRKDPAEILQAYSSTVLILSGNSTHLAPWHAKLGLQTRPYPFIATLHSLSQDGGIVSVMDLVVEKVHPIAFLEFIPSESGKSMPEGPRNEAEEARLNDEWKARRDVEEAKAREELNKKWARWENFEDRLERIAGSKFQPTEDEMPPDHIEDLFDELDDIDPQDASPFLRKLTFKEAGWLARFIHSTCERDKEKSVEEIQTDVNEKCPPRDVRNFRVIVVRDAQPSRRAGTRRAVLTVWDVLGLEITEGRSRGTIEVGQRFIVTNLAPNQPNSWMRDDPHEPSEIYLSTRRNSRFVKLK